jgi:hypothetical protein
VVQSLYIRALGLVTTVCYAVLIVWLYVHQPQSVAEVTGALSANIGTYQVDQQAFDEGLRLFRENQFAAARSGFERADPAHRDAKTQFYVAYSFYREGWGRLYNDDHLFTLGLEAASRAVALSPHGIFQVEDASLGIRTADELKAELESGLRRDVSDLNPLRIFRVRK